MRTKLLVRKRIHMLRWLALLIAIGPFVQDGKADEFDTMIRSGDQLRSQRKFELALQKFDLAREQAKNNSQRAIAYGKTAEVLSFDLNKHQAARQQAEAALAIADANSFAQVISLRVRANCQMKAEKDFDAARKTLRRALALRDVDWARPSLLLMLGDCHRQLRAYELALQTYERVLQFENASPIEKGQAQLNLGIVHHYDLRRLDRAKEHYSKAVRHHPDLKSDVERRLRIVVRKPGPRNANQRPLILAHYMPWYTAKPYSDRWGWHWTMNHFDPERQANDKREVASRYYPLIGAYDSADPAVLEYHLLLMKLSGIDGVIVDWYGRENFRDYAILHRNTTRLLQQCERLKMKFAICYEDQIIPFLVKDKRISTSDRVAHVAKDIEWLNKYWFQSPSYVRFEGKPLLLSFGHSGLTAEEWEPCLMSLDFPVAYFSQDVRRKGAMGGFGWPSPNEGLSQTERFLDESQAWPHAIPAAFPRFADIYGKANVSKSYPDIPDQEGRTLDYTLDAAIESKALIIQLATWNDWGEGTQIEPSREFGYRDLERLQAMRRKRFEPEFRPDSQSLRWPLRIFQLRRNKRIAPKSLDSVVDAIRDERWKTARSLFRSMEDPR